MRKMTNDKVLREMKMKEFMHRRIAEQRKVLRTCHKQTENWANVAKSLCEDLSQARERLKIALNALEDVETWRADAHDHDRDIGCEPRSFDDTDWESLEEFVRDIRRKLGGCE